MARRTAPNLTDGLDGLLTTVSIIILLAFFAVVKLYNEPNSLVVIAVMIGACLAFLFYNHHPARVFMGDTGSFFIGGMVVALAMVTKTELLIPAMCFTYLIEACSDIIQVAYIKEPSVAFSEAPLHHISNWAVAAKIRWSCSSASHTGELRHRCCAFLDRAALSIKENDYGRCYIDHWRRA